MLAYFEPPPVPVPEYRQLTAGDPAASWPGPGFYLAYAVRRCGIPDFSWRIAYGEEAGWSNAPAREIARVPIGEISTRATICLTRLVDPPHIFASLPSSGREPAVIDRYLHYIPPL